MDIKPIINSTKKDLFDKTDNQPLTPEEQQLYNDIEAWTQPANHLNNPDAPTIKQALRILNYIKTEHATTWDQAKERIMNP